MTIIAILTDPSAGGTFLTWSLHYLAGQKKYYHVDSSQWTELVDNPLTKINAHNFYPNQPRSIKELYHQINQLKNTPTDNFHTLYFQNLKDQPLDQVDRHQPSYDAIKNIFHHVDKIIVLSNSHPLYYVSKTKRVLNKKITNPFEMDKLFDEQHNEFVEYFYGESLKIWTNHGLTNHWDIREFLALNIRPLRQVTILPNIDLSREHYELDTFELYNVFDQTVDNLFDFTGIKLTPEKKSHWIPIYNKWKNIHTKRLIFAWYFNKIINYIINGFDMDLTRFDLDVVQEACIQHHLIYNHNLNLKTWQLKKFTNTQQLHNLLESNTHQLTAY